MLKVYLTDLAAYNSGALVGKFITFPLEEEQLHCLINEVLCEGEVAVNGDNHEETFITDWEWDSIDLFDIEEYEDIFSLNSKLKLLEHLEPINLKAVKFILDEHITDDIKDAILKSDDVIIHENISLEDYAYDLIQECYNIESLPSIIANHIDYEGIAKDLEYDGVYYQVNADVIEYIG